MPSMAETGLLGARLAAKAVPDPDDSDLSRAK
jgi:hypothetical protein